MATRSKAEYTLKSELYALADCGENRIADINSVQRAFCLFGRFLYTKKFFDFLHPPEHLPVAIWQIQRKGRRRMPLSRRNEGGGELV